MLNLTLTTERTTSQTHHQVQFGPSLSLGRMPGFQWAAANDTCVVAGWGYILPPLAQASQGNNRFYFLLGKAGIMMIPTKQEVKVDPSPCSTSWWQLPDSSDATGCLNHNVAVLSTGTLMSPYPRKSPVFLDSHLVTLHSIPVRSNSISGWPLDTRANFWTITLRGSSETGTKGLLKQQAMLNYCQSTQALSGYNT